MCNSGLPIPHPTSSYLCLILLVLPLNAFHLKAKFPTKSKDDPPFYISDTLFVTCAFKYHLFLTALPLKWPPYSESFCYLWLSALLTFLSLHSASHLHWLSLPIRCLSIPIGHNGLSHAECGEACALGFSMGSLLLPLQLTCP